MSVDHRGEDGHDHHRPDRALVPMVRLAGEEGDDVAEDPPGGEDEDVDLGVAEDPEEMLEEDGIAASAHRRCAGDEELGAEIPVKEQEQCRRPEHRDEERVQDGGQPEPPHREREPHVAHPRRAHPDHGGDVVDRAHRRGDAGDEDRRYDQRLAGPGRADVRGERRIGGPARASRAEIGEEGGEDEQLREEEGPERVHVQLRECHVARADHERDEEVAEAADEHRGHGEEDHDQAVGGEDLLVGRRTDHPAVLAEEKLADHWDRAVGERPLPADEHRERPADEQEEQACPEELLADHLVVDGEDVLAPERCRRWVDRLRRLGERLCRGAHGSNLLHSQPQWASLSSGSYARRASSAASASQLRKASGASTVRTARIL